MIWKRGYVFRPASLRRHGLFGPRFSFTYALPLTNTIQIHSFLLTHMPSCMPQSSHRYSSVLFRSRVLCNVVTVAFIVVHISGLATSFINEKNKNVVRDLCELLTESDQEVPTWLEAMSYDQSRGGGSRSRGGGGKRFGGAFGSRDYRQGNFG